MRHASLRSATVWFWSFTHTHTIPESIFQGIECFDYSKTLNALVTGSADHRVRVWNPYVTSKPVAVMDGHFMGIVNVRLHPSLALIFSYSKEGVSSEVSGYSRKLLVVQMFF